MRKFFLVLFLAVIFIGNVSALDFAMDNFKTFNRNIGDYGRVTVWDGGQIGPDTKLGDYEVDTNTDFCLVNCNTKKKIHNYRDGSLVDDVKFVNKYGKTTDINGVKFYILREETYIERIPEYTLSDCKETFKGVERDCTKTITGYSEVEHAKSVKEEYELGTSMPEGDYILLVEGFKNPMQEVDMIVKAHGKWMEEFVWWNANWNSQKQINITGGTTDLLNYSVYLEVDKMPGMQSDYDDLRFLNASEDGELYFDLDWKNSSGAGVWVNIQNMTSASIGNTTIYMYYNNSAATKVSDNYRDRTWGNRAVGVYHMTTNVVTNDSSISHNNLTIDAGVNINVTGTFGSQLHFPGDGGTGFKGESIKSSYGISGNSPFTILMKFSLNSTGNNGAMTEIGNDAVANEAVNFAQVAAGPMWRLAGFTGGGNFGSADTNSHWAIINYDSSTIDLYLDGDKDFTAGISLELANDSIYVGGLHANNQYTDLILDEYHIYNTSFSSEWMNRTIQLNNSNYYVFGDEVNQSAAGVSVGVVLNRPENNINTINTTTLFEANFTATDGNLTNASVLIWNADTTLFNKQTSGISGTSNQTGFNVSSFVPGTYLWSIEGCAYNSTSTICSVAVNRTLVVNVFQENAESYSISTTEGNTEVFQINITTPGIQVSTATLVYNNTNYSGITTNIVGYNYSLLSSITIPDLDVDANQTFYWDISLSGGYRANSTMHNQSVSALNLDSCSSNTVKIINFTIVDEETQNLITNTNISISNTSMEIALNIYSSNYTPVLNLSNNYTHINPVEFCLNVNLTEQSNYILETTTKYSAGQHAIEYYNIRDFNLNNLTIPQTIILYDLLSSDSTEFKVTFTDSNFVPVENALIYVDRQYVSEDAFKTVELPLTDSNGETVAHLVRNDIVYNIQVIKNGELLGSFQNIRAFCEDYTIGSCIVDLEGTSTADFGFSYDEATGLIFSSYPVYDENASTMSFSFITPSGTPQTVFMNVTRKDVFGNQSLCTDSLTSASGTLVCNVNPSIDDTTLETIVSVDGVPSVTSQTDINTTGLGSFGYLIWFILSLVIILMIGEHKTGVFIGMLVSYVGALSLGLIERTLFGVGAAGIWIITITIIGIYKLNKERQE